ncbi:MAG: lysylphosphatidylglycerol synthase transmembrane domain-containing protein [Actinomycetota bacterium]|nr:lysylphosphatidylglycerol synthase transmembrane domain-containing protein [Actinomycetota bacterium]
MAGSAVHVQPARRPWRAAVLAPDGDGATRRRGTDAARLATATAVVIGCWAVLASGPRFEGAVVGFVFPPPSGVRWLVTLVWWAGTAGVVVATAAIALAARRIALARDVVLAASGAWVAAIVIRTAAGPDVGNLHGSALVHVDLHYPQARVAAASAAALVAVPYLARGVQRVVVSAAGLATVAAVVNGSGLVLSVLAGVALGWGVAAAVRLAVGTPLGLLSGPEVRALLAGMGIGAGPVIPVSVQVWGVARYTTDVDGAPLDVSVYGRDARDAQLFAKAFRFAFYRDSGPMLTLTRLQQVEHEAYLTLLAGRRGARVPEVVDAGRAGPGGDAVLATRPPPGDTLAAWLGSGQSPGAAGRSTRVPVPAALSPMAVGAAFAQVARLRAARVAHGAIGPDTVVIDGDDAGFVDFRLAVSDATDPQLDRDVACLLAALCLAVGPEPAVDAAVAQLGPEVLTGALPLLQRAALPPALAARYRGRKEELTALRVAGAGRVGVEVPKLVETRRLSWVNLALVIGTLVGGWALLGVFVNVGKSFGTIAGADWGFVVAVVLVTVATYPAQAIQAQGAVLQPLPFGRLMALDLANDFVNLAGGTMGEIATRVRFFQQQGIDATVAVSSGVLVSTVSWIVKGALFLVALPFGLRSFHVTSSPSGGHAHLVWLVILVVAAVGVLAGVVLAVPRLRRLARDRLRPKLTDVRDQLVALSRRPRNLVQMFGGSLALQLLVALALSASLRSFGAHLSLATLLVAITAAGVLGGASPVPGGVGVVEAGMILALTSAGVPQDEAVAAVFVQRLFTSYIPPVIGWFTLVWMRRREYI